VPDWHRQVLDERLAAYRANPDEGRPWQEVRAELLRKLRDRAPERGHAGSSFLPRPWLGRSGRHRWRSCARSTAGLSAGLPRRPGTVGQGSLGEKVSKSTTSPRATLYAERSPSLLTHGVSSLPGAARAARRSQLTLLTPPCAFRSARRCALFPKPDLTGGETSGRILSIRWQLRACHDEYCQHNAGR
jgi:hypothetical protein